MIEISLEQARTLQIYSLGLGRTLGRNPELIDVLNVIHQLGLLQLDTIHVIARSHYFVIWSRLGYYPYGWLDELLVKSQLFEYWAHAACLIPIEDYPIFRTKMLSERQRITDSQSWYFRNSDFIQHILRHIQKNGPVKSSDFKPETARGGTWWDWKAEKSALEQLYDIGELMIARREKFQRVYDLAERVNQRVLNLDPVELEIGKRILIERTIKILGVALPEWIADYYRLKKAGIPSIIADLVDKGIVYPIQIENWRKTAYIHRDQLSVLEKIIKGYISAKTTHLLSPFDPLVWDRFRLKTLFGMEFQVECYTPASKRKYGYWLLPVLHKERMIARVDLKANRQRKVFEVKGLFLEDGVLITDEMIHSLARCLVDCAAWHQTPQVEIMYAYSDELKNEVTKRIKEFVSK